MDGIDFADEPVDMKSARGLTLIELQIALALFLIMTAMAMAGVNAALPSIRVDSEVSRVMGLLQTAREMAIAKQRDVEVRFDTAAHTVFLLRHEGDVEVPMTTLVFESKVRFTQFAGMGDTPEGFGASELVDFGGADVLMFISDGSFVDEAGIPVNGSIYLGIEEHRETARAITLTGSTARARFYKWSPPSESWEGGWSAR